jgi:hypothetical protein
MATGEATGNVQRNRIVKSEQGKAGLRFSGTPDSPIMSKKDVLPDYRHRKLVKNLNFSADFFRIEAPQGKF